LEKPASALRFFLTSSSVAPVARIGAVLCPIRGQI